MSKPPVTTLSWTVDSIEEGIASVFDADERRLGLPVWMLPPDVGEGDVLAIRAEPAGTGDEVEVRITLDRDATHSARARSVRQLAELDRLQQGAEGSRGDIVL